MAILEQFYHDFPKCFQKDNRQPLMLGIHHGLAKIYQGKYDKRQIRAAIKDYVTSPEYLANIVEGRDRIDLNGESCDEPIKGREERYARVRLSRGSLATPFEALAFLKQTFPQCFIKGKDKRPVALDIKKELAPFLIDHPQFNEHIIYTAVDLYTGGRCYLSKLIADSERVNLQGQGVAKVTAHEAEIAQQKLQHMDSNNG